MPLGKDVGENIKTLRRENTSGRPKRGTKAGKKRSKKQILAIALSEARRHGNRQIKPPPNKRSSHSGSGRTGHRARSFSA